MTPAHPPQPGLTRPGLDAVFREARWGLIEVAPDGTVLRANPALEQRLGYEPGELEGMDVLLLTPEDERARTADFLGRVLAGEDVELPFRKRCLCKDGSERHEEVWVSRLTDEEGRVVSVFAQMEDVTERRIAERALERDRATFTAGPVVVLRWGPVRGAPVEYVTPNVEDLLGVSAEALLSGRTKFADLVHPEDLERVRNEVTAYLEAGVERFDQEYRFVRPDGRTVWVSDYTIVERDDDGNLLGFSGYVLDDTRRHAAEVALRETAASAQRVAAFSQSLLPCRDAEELTARILDEMGAAFGAEGAALFWLGDADGSHLVPAVLRGSLARIDDDGLAVSREALSRLAPAGALPVVRPGDLGEGWKQVLAALPVETVVVLRPLRTGGLLQGAVLLVGAPGVASAPACEHLDRLGPAIAMTLQRLRIEDTQRRLQDRLRRAQRLESVGRLASGVAHSFNNALTVVLGHAERLESALPAGTAEHASAVAIRAAGRAAAEVVRQLLDFGRSGGSGGATPVEPAVSRLRQMLPVALGPGVKLSFEFEDDECHLALQPGDLEHLIMDLVLNARDAVQGRGRVAVRFRREDESERLGGRSALLVEVEDDGHGMDEATRSRAFDPFFTTKSAGEGHGLGLSSVYGIVRGAGGDLAVRSAPGEGTTVRVWLPLVVSPGGDRSVEPETEPGFHGCVLVVEDEPAVAHLVATALEAAGWTVALATSSHEAIARLSEPGRPVDVVVSDLLLAGPGGDALARRLAETGGPPLVLLTGAADSDERLLAIPGVEAVVRKPFDAARLLAVITETMAARR